MCLAWEVIFADVAAGRGLEARDTRGRDARDTIARHGGVLHG